MPQLKRLRHPFAAIGAFALCLSFLQFLPASPAMAAPNPPQPYASNNAEIWFTADGKLFAQNAETKAFDQTSATSSVGTYNALGYDVRDHYLYALTFSSNAASSLVRIGADGTTQLISGVTGPAAPSAGTFGGVNGTSNTSDVLYVLPYQGTSLTAIDLTSCVVDYTGDFDADTASAFYSQGDASGCAKTATYTVTGLTSNVQLADLFYMDGYLWSVSGTTIYRISLPTAGQASGTSVSMTSWNMTQYGLATNTAASGSNPNGFVSSTNFPAQWVYGNGNFAVVDGSSGYIYQINVTFDTNGRPTFSFVGAVAGQSTNLSGGQRDAATFAGTSPVDLSLVKTATPTYAPGDTITYTFTVKNNNAAGGVASSGWWITDDMTQVLADAQATTANVDFTGTNCYWLTNTTQSKIVRCDGDGLAAQATAPTISFKLTVPSTADASKLADIENTATVFGNESEPSPDPNDNTSSATSTPALLTFAKTVSPDTLVAGQNVTYTFSLANVGNVPLTNVNIVEKAFDGYSNALQAIKCPGGQDPTNLTLGAKGAADGSDSITCTATYTVQQSDVDRGELSNTAQATYNVNGTVAPPTDPSTATITDPQTGSISLDKQVVSVTPAGSETPYATNVVQAAGDTVNYKFTVTNTGPVTLTNVHVDDTSTPGAGVVPSVTMDPADTDTGTPSCSALPDLPPAPPAATDDSQAPDEPQATGAPDGTDDPAADDVPAAAPNVVTCYGSYTVQQSDIDDAPDGQLSNTATAYGTSPAQGTNPAEVVDDSDTANVPVNQNASVSLKKTATESAVESAGDTIHYTFTVTNTGDVTLNTVQVVDPMLSSSEGNVVCANVGPLPPYKNGANPAGQTTCTGTYTLSQADSEKSSIDNTAYVYGWKSTDPDTTDTTSADANDTADETVPVTPHTGIELTKSADPTSVENVGDPVTYTFTVTNTGNVPLTDVQVSDPMIKPDVDGSGSVVCGGDSDNPLAGTAQGDDGTVDIDGASLQPGQTVSCTATYAATQGDIDAGGFTNTATATGTPPDEMTPPSDTASAPVTAARSASLSLVKSADYGYGSDATQAQIDAAPKVDAAGQQVTYGFTVTNTGNVTLYNVKVMDPMFGTGPVCEIDELPAADPDNPDANVHVCDMGDMKYTVTQDDIDAGYIYNEATASADAPAGVADPADSTSSWTVDATQTAKWSVDKSASPSEVSEPGDVTYTFTVTNEGNTTLQNVTVTDPMTESGLVLHDCSVAELAPQDPDVDGSGVFTCTGTYPVSQAEIDAGATIYNSATATATPPEGVTPEDPEPQSPEVPVTIDQKPSLTLEKDAKPTSVTAADQEVTYTFTVTNTGYTTLMGVQVMDPMFDKTTPICTDADPLPPASAVTEEDPDANVYTCTKTYMVTQADIDAGQPIVNEATANGWSPNLDVQTDQPDATDTDDATVNVQKEGLSLTKTAAPKTVTAAGQTVTYTFVVTNTGTVPLTDVQVSDPMLNPDEEGNVVCTGSGELQPKDSVTCDVDYTVTQDDMNKGEIDNTATATGKVPADSGLDNPSATDSEKVTATADPGLSVVKKVVSVTPANSETPYDSNVVQKAGDVIRYSFTVENTGNVTLTDVTVNDPMFGSGPVCEGGNAVGGLTATDSNGDPILDSNGQPITGASLAPGQTVSCTADWTVTQEQFDAGSIVNTASATGTPPDSETPLTPEPSNPVTVETNPNPAWTIQKLASTGQNPVSAGDKITYTFIVTNTGNVTLDPVWVTDPMFGDALVNCTDANPLPPATSNTAANPTANVYQCTSPEYTVTPEDIEAGVPIENTATAHATPPEGVTPPEDNPTDTVEVPVDQNPHLSLTKVVNPTEVQKAGESVEYTLTVVNDGGVKLQNVVVTDPMYTNPDDDSNVVCSFPTLDVNESQECSFSHEVSQTEFDSKSFTNTATAVGWTPNHNPETNPTPDATDTADATVTAQQNPQLVLTKTASPTTMTTVGQTITYSLTVQNTGDTTLHNVTVNDPMFGSDPVCSGLTLAVGSAAVTCGTSYTHTVTAADLTAGKVSNTATADSDEGAKDTKTVDVTVDKQPGLKLIKSASAATVNAAGDPITYTVSVQNTGNTVLTNVVVTDDMYTNPNDGSDVLCTLPSVPIGDNQVLCGTFTYKVTQTDIDAGDPIVNTANVTADGDLSGEAKVPTTIVQNPSLTLSKTVDKTSGAVPDDQLVYTFTMTNSGNVSLLNVTAQESAFSGTGDQPTIDGDTCQLIKGEVTQIDGQAALAPGGVIQCQSTPYSVTVDDAAAGIVTNTAVANGTTPGGTNVPAEPSTAETTCGPAPTIPAGPTVTVTETTPGPTVTETTETPGPTTTVTETTPGPTVTETTPGPTVTETTQTPGPTTTVTQTEPGPTNTVTETQPGPTNTVTETQPGPTNTVTETQPGPTNTVTETVPGPTTTSTEPGPTVTITGPTQTVTTTVTAPGPTNTVTETQTEPGPTTTVTETEPGPTQTNTVTETVPGPTSTVTQTEPGPTTTVTEPGPTVTVTVTVPPSTTPVETVPVETSAPATTTPVPTAPQTQGPAPSIIAGPTSAPAGTGGGKSAPTGGAAAPNELGILPVGSAIVGLTVLLLWSALRRKQRVTDTE